MTRGFVDDDNKWWTSNACKSSSFKSVSLIKWAFLLDARQKPKTAQFEKEMLPTVLASSSCLVNEVALRIRHGRRAGLVFLVRQWSSESLH
jgi:hypothetical protein